MSEQKPTPDWCYDANHWEYTLQYGDRADLADYAAIGEIVHVKTLINGPDKFAVWITSDEGQELLWFDHIEAARTALKEKNNG